MSISYQQESSGSIATLLGIRKTLINVQLCFRMETTPSYDVSYLPLWEIYSNGWEQE